MITRPKLPPRKGYVEVEVNGERTYRNVKTGLLIEEEALIPPTPTEAERLATVEQQLAEADEVAIQLYESQIEQDEAIIEIYEMLEGVTNG